MSLRGDFYTYLGTVTGVTDLVSTRIYQRRASTRATSPYIVLSRIGTVDNHHMGAVAPVAKTLLGVDIWADTSASADAVALAVRAALQGNDRTTLGSTKVLSCRMYDEDESDEPVQVPGTQENQWHITQTYEIHHIVTVPTFPAFINTKSIDFDGINDHLLVSADAAIDDLASTGFGISVWINPRSDGEGSFGRIMQKGPGTGTRGWALYVWGQSGPTVNLALLGSFSVAYGAWFVTAAANISEWTHIVVAWDGTATAPVIYIDGVAAAVGVTQAPSGTYVPDTGADDLYIGTRATADRTFNGRIDEPALFDYEPTAGQAALIYNSRQAADLANITGLTAPVWWLRNGDDASDSTASGGYVQDQIGTNHAAATNMVAGDIVTDTYNT